MSEANRSAIEIVLTEARALALETGGERAARAVSETASLERDIGLGSLERVELITRIERRAERDGPWPLLRYRTGVDILHVPYRGGADSLTDLDRIAGR